MTQNMKGGWLVTAILADALKMDTLGNLYQLMIPGIRP